MKYNNKRLLELDIATGIAIFLVVLGHFASRTDPNDIYWYTLLKTIIYKFHMPFFMFLSGAIYYYKFVPTNSINKYLLFIQKKAIRLFPGFILIGFTIIFGKYFASFFLHVDNNNLNILNNIFRIIFFPSESVAGGLWYIYVLFQLFILFQTLNVLFKKNIYFILFISFILHFSLYCIEITNLFMIDKLFEYSLYFSLGYIYIQNRLKILLFFKKSNIVSFIIIVVFILSFFLINRIEDNLSKTIIGLVSIPSLIIIILKLNYINIKRIFLYLSEYTYTIYLMNTIIIGLLKGLSLKFLDWGGINFIIIFPFFLIGGIFGPIIIHKYLIKNKFLSKITK